MSGSKKKVPSLQYDPSGSKVAKFGATPESSEKEKPCWQLGCMDFDGPWTWHSAGRWEILGDIHEKLKNFETMTWAEIARAAGGRNTGNNSHAISVADISPEAQRRLGQLGHKDVSELFSLRLSGKQRVWGIKSGRVLKVIWWDPEHAIYQSKK